MILTDVENNYQVSIEEEKAIIRSNSEEKGYSIIESKGSLETKGFCVLNNVYINTGMEKAFEARFLNRQSNLATVTGFKALRVMKAESGPYYVILTLWDSAQDFHNWQESNQYKKTHKKRGTSSGLDREVVSREHSFNIRFHIQN